MKNATIMKPNTLSILNIIITITAFCLLRFCGTSPQPINTHSEKITHSEKQLQDNNVYKTVYNYSEKKAETVKENPVPITVDSLEIVKLYFATHHYELPLEDTNVRASISVDIAQNKVGALVFSSQLKRPTNIITNTSSIVDNTTVNNYNKFIAIQGNIDNTLGFKAGLVYASDKWVFALAVDPFNIAKKDWSKSIVQGSVGYKIINIKK